MRFHVHSSQGNNLFLLRLRISLDNTQGGSDSKSTLDDVASQNDGYYKAEDQEERCD